MEKLIYLLGLHLGIFASRTSDYRCNSYAFSPISFYEFCRADSVAWNPHKMLLAGIQCCALLVKDNSVSPSVFCLFVFNAVDCRCCNEEVEIRKQLSQFYYTVVQKLYDTVLNFTKKLVKGD